jgi:hypothetical protein
VGQHTGLFFINSLPSLDPDNQIVPLLGCVDNDPQVEIIGATVFYPAAEVEMEALTWNRAGTVLYGIENSHDEIRLWAYDTDTGFIGHICSNLVSEVPGEIEALEALPRNTNPPPPGFQELLLLGFHGPQQVRYAAVSVNFNNSPPECQIIYRISLQVLVFC